MARSRLGALLAKKNRRESKEESQKSRLPITNKDSMNFIRKLQPTGTPSEPKKDRNEKIVGMNIGDNMIMNNPYVGNKRMGTVSASLAVARSKKEDNLMGLFIRYDSMKSGRAPGPRFSKLMTTDGNQLDPPSDQSC